MSDAAPLPPELAALEPFAGWALPTETERNRKRIASTQAEIDAFAEAMLPRVDALCAYLAAYPLDALPEGPKRLLDMLLSLAEVAPSYEGYRAPTVPDGYDSRAFVAQEDFPLRPRV